MTILSQRDQSAVWHPYTQHQTSSLPIPIVKGAGAYLYDSQGKRYLDCVSSWWVNIHGHGHPLIAQAIYQQALQLEHVMFAGFTHEPAVVLAEQLLALLPQGYSKVFYSDNGSTAVEVALKMAYQYWRNQGEKQRRRFLAFSGGYHGDTFGAMALGKSSGYFQQFSDLLFTVDFAPYPSTWRGDDEVAKKESTAIAWIENYFQQYAAETAAIIIEPLIQGASGMQVCRSEFLSVLEKLAHAHGVLIIYDEVMTGFGRTGELFACKKAVTNPDIICLSKGLTGGFLPLAVTACHEYIYQSFLNDNIEYAFMHGHSYTANPLGCAAALASLQLLIERQQHISLIESVHYEAFDELKILTGIEKIRHCGTMAAFNLRVGAGYGSKISVQLRQRFLDRGLLIRPLGNTIYLLPPYCITADELRNVYEVMIEIVKELS